MQHWIPTEAQLAQLVWPAATFAIAFAVALGIRHAVLRGIRHAAGPKSFGAVFAATISAASVFWCLAAALFTALRFADLTADQVWWTNSLIGASVIISLTLVVSSALERSIAAYGERQNMPLAMAGLSRTLIRVVVALLGLMALLANFDRQITPLLTALGVGGIAVALALQDTLANFFAGLHILVEQPIFVGDFIKLESGQEGVVTDIGWRTTRVRTGGNDMVVIPNVKITSGILVNYTAPEQRSVATIEIVVAHEADPDAVCRIALEEAAQVEGVLAEPAPACNCDPGVLPTHIGFKLFVHVARRQDQWGVQSAIRMRLLRRFRAEGIPLPKLEAARAATA